MKKIKLTREYYINYPYFLLKIKCKGIVTRSPIQKNRMQIKCKIIIIK